MGSAMPGMAGAMGGAAATGGTGMGLDMGGPAFSQLMQPNNLMSQLPGLLQKGGQAAGSGQSRGMQDIGMGMQGLGALAQFLPFLLA